MKKEKLIKIECWVAFCEENKEYTVYSTRKTARIGVDDMKGFDLDVKVKKAKLIIYK